MKKKHVRLLDFVQDRTRPYGIGWNIFGYNWNDSPAENAAQQ